MKLAHNIICSCMHEQTYTGCALPSCMFSRKDKVFSTWSSTVQCSWTSCYCIASIDFMKSMIVYDYAWANGAVLCVNHTHESWLRDLATTSAVD